MTMTPDAKKALSTTIRGLRSRLLDDLHAAVEGAYRPSIRARDAGLSEASRVRRKRLEAWIDEQLRAEAETELAKTRESTWSDQELRERRALVLEDLRKKGASDRFRRDVEKQAAYTLLNRLVILRLMESAGLREPKVVTGGWDSRAYKDFRQLAPALVRGDESEGYAFLLQLVFEDLATDLPGLFGSAGVAELVPVPAATLRHLVEELDKEDLESCWGDDMTLGWVYQYWNDPEREALDDKLNAGGKVEPHEIASKTQMFTERYMVDWLLQNSLGPMWFAMCTRHGWTPEVEANGTLARLKARRAEWREKREAGEVELTALMPLQGDEERRWAYFVPQPIPDDAVEHAPDSLRELRILDPAVGSGHFLVVALDLLLALYREEARHRGEAGRPRWSDRAVIERILEHNLHGIDLDPRAVQIAAAALWLKAKQVSAEAQPAHLNLVASNLRLASLPDNDPALVELRREVERETGIPGALTDTVVHALRGADHLGSLLKIDVAVDEALRRHEAELGRLEPEQGGLWQGFGERRREPVSSVVAKASIVQRLEAFLARHTSGDDLGLRLRGEQLAAGVRFVRTMREAQYDVVVGNPPYQATTKMAEPEYLRAHYAKGKADLYAAFIQRGVEFATSGGTAALLTMRNWLFIKQYSALRRWVFERFDVRAVGDFAIGAFDEVPNDVLSVAVSVLRKRRPLLLPSMALQPTPSDDRSYDRERTPRKRAATLCQEGLYSFAVGDYEAIELWPLVFWWPRDLLERYLAAPKLGAIATVTAGAQASPRTRFLHFFWEFRPATVVAARRTDDLPPLEGRHWVPYIGGGQGRKWVEPLVDVIDWRSNGLTLKVWHEWKTGTVTKRVAGQDFYFAPGVSATAMGHTFQGRMQRFLGIPSEGNPAVYGDGRAAIVCNMNGSQPAYVLQCFNPGTAFEVGDVKRLPLFPIDSESAIWKALEAAFAEHESHREPSHEFQRPGPSPWHSAQDWAQAAVDRRNGTPLAVAEFQYDPEPPTDHLSYALGLALGRFGGNNIGVIDPRGSAALARALPAGILFLDGTLDTHDRRDSLGHRACEPLHDAWAEHGPHIDTRCGELRDYLRLDFFEGVHRKMYESRPIHWPLSSQRKTFVAWVTIHRWTADTLRILLADHLQPAFKRLDGELIDLRAAREGADRRAARDAERRYAKVQRWRDELASFIADVEQCAEKGPPPTHPDPKKCPPREIDARYVPDLDDGVMINSAALWPLLQPQWSGSGGNPKNWWKELANAKGRKDYDWSHLAMRYWPTRVDKKCRKDPSLGVAHGCFWKYHSDRAWTWELRLQDEIGPDFRIEEPPYRGDGGHEHHRAVYLQDHPERALQAVEKEVLRRRGRGSDKTDQAELRLLETGLWSTVPHLCWELETRIIEKQEAAFRLVAPDEEAARAAFVAAHPRESAARERLLKRLQPLDLFRAGEDNHAR